VVRSSRRGECKKFVVVFVMVNLDGSYDTRLGGHTYIHILSLGPTITTALHRVLSC
jgi:uncharacterized membrane protein